MRSAKRSHAMSILWMISVVLFSCQSADSGEDFTRTPVFFIHGYGLKADYWQTMIKRMEKDGYPKSYLRAIQLTPANGANISAAKRQIAPEIEDFLEEVNQILDKRNSNLPPKEKVDIIAHSMGALSARWYAAKLKPERVRKWISLAGAHHGTDALCGRNSGGADDLCPSFATSSWKSRIQYKLNGEPKTADVDETPYGVGRDAPGTETIFPQENKKIYYWSIRTSPDRWIVPEQSAILNGAGGLQLSIPESLPVKVTSPGNYLMTNKVGHDSMVSNKDTIEFVKFLLSELNRQNTTD